MLSFETDIKPLFRTKDRDSMLAAFLTCSTTRAWSRTPMR